MRYFSLNLILIVKTHDIGALTTFTYMNKAINKTMKKNNVLGGIAGGRVLSIVLFPNADQLPCSVCQW